MDDINAILESKEVFHKYIYTNYETALQELEQRKTDSILTEKLSKYLHGRLPAPLVAESRSILFRQLATPNFEIRRFLFITSFADLKPLLWEYHRDKFAPHNPMKKHLGKLPIVTGYSKNGDQRTEYSTVVDFNTSNGTAMNDMITLWGESFVDFHHSLFKESNTVHPDGVFFDASEWFHEHGGTAKDYYIHFMALFFQNAIWFENFVFDDPHEREFLEQIILPGIQELYNETGYKPLIVALEPTEIEGDLFWYSYPREVGEYIKGKVK